MNLELVKAQSLGGLEEIQPRFEAPADCRVHGFTRGVGGIVERGGGG